MYKKKDALDKEIKPLLLKFLAKMFGYKDYPHSFKDQWIIWSIWQGRLSIIFDSRVTEQKELIKAIPLQFMGIPQKRTLKIVNKNCFYLQLIDLLDIEYPDIIGYNLISKNKLNDGDGDYFYTYDWEVSLSDGTSIFYHNQSETMDMIKGDYSYNNIIQERAFVEYLKAIK